ncbi:Monopolin complex subunit Csm1/Pcs1 [Penicillium maclennaniae]|uniref:Monopolin complex subunit Csm1/Pcs1 n=1 Tax=Penicillium maclennaniae TaxID=1343394 RepID=UPI00254245A8|nr:Monopolin complex subunit Csm1/Pcs1 [Penicillium maclennaniae]KAJ5681694.1 Monopolin complex subunit Csm1/Pcs1 [Penicillium maclennaniae]
MSPPVKRRRGRPRTSNEPAAETKNTRGKKQASEPPSQDEAAAARKPVRRGRPRGSSRTADNPAGQERAAVTQEPMEEEDSNDQENEDPMATKGTKTSRAATKAKPAATATATATAARRRARASSVAKQTDGEFEYTPTRAAQVQQVQGEPEVLDSQMQEAEPEVDESILLDPPSRYASSSLVKHARARMTTVRTHNVSPNKRQSSFGVEQGVDPDLRRRIGDLTKKHDGLESKYRNLREIGIVEANANMEKLRRQCESITAASNELVASLRTELEAQRALGQQSRSLQKQLKDRDVEMAQIKTEAEEARSQLAATQAEAKALQTKLAAARSTAASLESVAKVPGSAMKVGVNRATAAVSAEAAQAAQLALLKEELYTDLTGLIIRDVKNRETDHLYDCIQTGVNGSEYLSLYYTNSASNYAAALHFKLVIPKVVSSKYESAEFQYLPLLDANRDRELMGILPEFLRVDITFSRGQASKFYTRVIDALTKRRSSSA